MWYYLHTGLQFTGFFIGFAGVVAGIALFDKLHAPVPAHVPAHRGLGIFILCLSILQVRKKNFPYYPPIYNTLTGNNSCE